MTPCAPSGVDPDRKLVTPRIFACITMLFFLTIVADFFGILGGAAVTVFMNHQNGTQYFSMAYEYLRFADIMQGLVKPLFSGFIIASIGCFYGLRTTGGTEGRWPLHHPGSRRLLRAHHLC